MATAVRHPSPDFPFSRRPCYSPVSQPSSSSRRPRPGVRGPRCAVRPGTHVSPSCWPRLPILLILLVQAAARAACESSGPHFGHASTFLACLDRVVGRRRHKAASCVDGGPPVPAYTDAMQSRPIEPAASLCAPSHHGLACLAPLQQSNPPTARRP
jgi:hypothetical protein